MTMEELVRQTQAEMFFLPATQQMQQQHLLQRLEVISQLLAVVLWMLFWQSSMRREFVNGQHITVTLEMM